ncbi:MAG: extracellular solute-binding protein [Limnothrix sp. RL_2_0]|nr:extracellular solute-binding protein [Limnothrix sp. RL_2_0]
MLHRRQFLSISGTFALTSLMGGCGRSPASILQIKTLEGSVSPQLLATFRRQWPDELPMKFRPVEQLAELFAELEGWRNFDPAKVEKRYLWNWFKDTAPMDLVTIGHGWLRQAIAEELIQPLPLAQLEAWETLPELWRNFIERDDRGKFVGSGETGEVWGMPYRWGTTLILYRKDKLKPLGWVPEDWSDLWREDIGDRLSLLNHSREVIGMTLKKMGYSYNETNLGAIAGLEDELKALHKNVKSYSSTHYLQPLITDDTWIAQAWSQDAIPLLERYPKLGAVVPKSGTALWCDLWVQPTKNTTKFEQLQPWLDFCWSAAAANQIALSTNGASPAMYQTQDLDPEIKNNPLIWVDPEIFKQSEIIQVLAPGIEADYRQLWQKIRQA